MATEELDIQQMDIWQVKNSYLEIPNRKQKKTELGIECGF